VKQYFGKFRFRKRKKRSSYAFNLVSVVGKVFSGFLCFKQILEYFKHICSHFFLSVCVRVSDRSASRSAYWQLHLAVNKFSQFQDTHLEL